MYAKGTYISVQYYSAIPSTMQLCEQLKYKLVSTM
jgi:hypothetical protein